MMKILNYLIVIFVCFDALETGQVHVPQQPARYDWCDVDEHLTLHECRNSSGEKLGTVDKSRLETETYCKLVHDNQTFSATCIEGVFTVFFQNEGLIRIKRQADGTFNPMDVAGGSAVAGVGGYTAAGATIGAMFGPIGLAVGAGIGFIGDIICMFACHHADPPPPNHPPKITQHAALSTGTPIYADAGKIKAIVKWEDPIMKDDEDGGNVEVQTNPSNFVNGGEFSEGSYVVYFVGTDKGGLTITDYLSFEVKVYRCGFPRWPENGYIDCGGQDVIYGTECTVQCKSGYVLDEGANSKMTCGKGSSWSPPRPPDCQARACAKAPNIPHGEVQCLNNKMVYDNMCEAVCEDGYQVRGMHLMGCDKAGVWGSAPACKDVMPPRFLAGECPVDMQVYVDRVDNTVEVVWEVPKGTDNSNENVTIKETHGYIPGKRMAAGAHTVKYTIEDKEQNVGDSCTFSVQVLSLSCTPPNLQVTGADHLKYDCPDSYTLGASCNLACKSGYPMGGTQQIQCLKEPNSFPPKLDWKWQVGALAPFCKETNCSRAALKEPLHGALACSDWTHGQMCQMQCESGFDIPNIGDGNFVCGRSDGLWRPTSNVPDCDTKINVNSMHLPNEFFYYTGQCNSSAANLLQIQENFVRALNTSKYREECVGVPECQARFVDVTCGPVSGRKRRETNHNVERRSASKYAYTLHFDLVLPFKQLSGKTIDDVFADNEDLLLKMSDVIQKDIDNGHFDLGISDLHVESDSYGPGRPAMICPNGTIPRKESGTCIGCPKGSFSKNEKCKECPIGWYQDVTNSESCKLCPTNTNTTEAGATNISQCLEYCEKGTFSLNSLAPCTKCPSNSYQPNDRATSCLLCESNKKTSALGAQLKTQCQAYDVQTGLSETGIQSKHIVDSLTFFMWAKISKSNKVRIQLVNKGASKNITLNLHPAFTLEQTGSTGINIGTGLVVGKWSAVAITLDRKTSEVKLFVNGKEIYRNASITFPAAHILDIGDTVTLQGEMTISALHLLPRVAVSAEITGWSTTCLPSITGAILTTDDLSESGNVNIILPSVCDAYDECDRSPCGKFQCINKIGSYSCVCTEGFSGQQCEVPPDFCKNNTCQNGGTCVNGISNYTCSCAYGFGGDRCQIKAVDGQWSVWTDWTGCSKTCGGGLMTRTRKCDSPSPDPEGASCVGRENETLPCEVQDCPECEKLRRTYGLSINCNETNALKHCVIECRPGLYFTTPPLPYYECGVATGYKWNHQTDENPNGRLPSCSELMPPKEIGVTFDGHYDSVPCTEANMQTIKNNLQVKLELLECKTAGNCETTMQEPTCSQSSKKRSVGSVSVTVKIHAAVHGDGGPLNVAGLLQNKSAPSQDLVDLVRQTLELEKSAQKIMNNSIDFFQVTIDGTQHNINPPRPTYTPSTVCPSGTIRLEVFCAECPEGSYSDGRRVFMCPLGQYQDLKGQSSCKSCPAGKTTTGIGSVHLLECSVDTDSIRNKDTGYNSVEAVQIGVGVAVSICFVVLCVLAIVYLIKRIKKRKSKVNDSAVDLHENKYFHMQSKPVYDKDHLYE